MKRFGDYLREHLDAKKMRPAELARLAGVTKQNIGRLLNNTPHSVTGAPPTPERETVEKLAKALDWDVNDALLAAGYAPQETVTLDISPDLRVALLKKDVTPADRERFELALKMAYETAKAIIDREREANENKQ